MTEHVVESGRWVKLSAEFMAFMFAHSSPTPGKEPEPKKKGKK